MTEHLERLPSVVPSPVVEVVQEESEIERPAGSDIASDCRHQSASDKHGHQVEHGTRRVWGDVQLNNVRNGENQAQVKNT